ncbi:MAG: IS630 family transposase, partial [Nitrospirae bacterium]|nr:IS630 family transposase [Nitrospirota bacterium]
MSRKAQQLQCSEGERKVLEEWARSRTLEARMVERAKII